MRPKLFEPFRLKGVTARNRVVVSPMCQYASHEGSPTDWHFANLGRYAVGGAGIVFYEDTAIEDSGRKTPHCAAFCREDQIPAFRRITSFLSGLGAVPAMQLGHGGSKGSTKGPHERELLARGQGGWETISASSVPATPDLPAPRAMSKADIRDIVAKWGFAARLSDEAGFEILEVHGAHGYLIQQFLSPVTNHRTDGYGGDLAGRMRFALEVTEEVRRIWPENKPLFFRVSVVDGEGGVWSLADTIELCRALKERGVDVIDCSSGGIHGTSTMGPVPRLPGYHVPYAGRIKEATGLATMAPGFITEAHQAEDLLQSGAIDLVAMARELMNCSEWPIRAAEALGVPDYLDLFPPQFAFRLSERERSRRMAINQPGAPFPE